MVEGQQDSHNNMVHNKSLLKKVSNKFGIKNYYTDYKEIFLKHKIDAAIVVVEKENYFKITKYNTT